MNYEAARRHEIKSNVIRVVNDLLGVTQCKNEEIPHGAWQRLEEPDVCHRNG